MKKIVMMITASACAVVLFSALPAGAAGAAKEALRGPDAVVFCDSNQQIGDVSQAGPGFVIFNQDASGGVHANVVLQGASPNTTYVVRLIQAVPDGSDCYNIDGTITTNRQGNGQLNIVEPTLAGATSAQVIIDTSSLFNTPTYAGSDLYALS